jgi:hypothetical protein
MVQLFAYENGQAARPTTDVDILADARDRPSKTEVVAGKLHELGAHIPEPTGIGRDTGYGFELAGELVEVLGPDGLRRKPRTIGNLETIEIPGGTQALKDTEVVEIVVAGGRPVRVRRPTLIAALLLKARAVPVHARPDDQLRDVVQLLGFIDDPRLAREHVTGRERKWLTDISPRLDFEDSIWREQFAATHVQRARAAFALLTV